MGNVHTVGPNEALIVSGGCFGSLEKKMVVGGWAWAWWFVTDVQKLSLGVITLNPRCESVETSEGVPLSVTGVAQCKIIKQPEILTIASEQFLGKPIREVQSTILQTLEGHLRAILGTLTVEEVCRDRDQFAALVREVAAPDVGRMGVEVLSFTIKDVYDDVEYLMSLGRSRTAAVKRDADTGVAMANRDAGICESECEKLAMDTKYRTDTKIEDNTKTFKLRKAQYEAEVSTARAETQLAYELQEAKEKQKIRSEEIAIDIIERKKQIQIENEEVKRKERELVANVKLPAEAESFKVEAIAGGQRAETLESARADAESIRLIGTADAARIENVGRAEAEKMRLKAAAYRQYDGAALYSMVLEALPKLAAEISAPMSRVDEIVLLSGESHLTSEITQMASQLPPALSAVSNCDIVKLVTQKLQMGANG